jgi:hypothetical protein
VEGVTEPCAYRATFLSGAVAIPNKIFLPHREFDPQRNDLILIQTHVGTPPTLSRLTRLSST